MDLLRGVSVDEKIIFSNFRRLLCCTLSILVLQQFSR
jgi:hypothetical protein